MLTVTQILPANAEATVVAELALTAHERTRSRHRFVATNGLPIQLNLPRGSLLRGNTLLGSADGQRVRVIAKPESVLKVTATSPLALMRAAYHLGNRHVPLEIAPNSLTLEPDSVLEAMLIQLGGLTVESLVQPFEPEAGAYHSGPAHGADTHADPQATIPHSHHHHHGT
ncbi:MAG: Urease accessory protein UreE [Cyanobacteriota bacterium]